MSDPRTTVAQALQAALTAELADNDGWEMLQDLAEQLGHDDVAAQASKAGEEEQEHLESVRTWISNTVLAEAMGADALGEDRSEEDGRTKKPRAQTAKKKSSRSKGKRKKK